jgi:hypothetical protein
MAPVKTTTLTNPHSRGHPQTISRAAETVGNVREIEGSCSQLIWGRHSALVGARARQKANKGRTAAWACAHTKLHSCSGIMLLHSTLKSTGYWPPQSRTSKFRIAETMSGIGASVIDKRASLRRMRPGCQRTLLDLAMCARRFLAATLRCCSERLT